MQCSAVARVPGCAADDLAAHREPDADFGAQVKEGEVIVGLVGTSPHLRNDRGIDVLLEHGRKASGLRKRLAQRDVAPTLEEGRIHDHAAYKVDRAGRGDFKAQDPLRIEACRSDQLLDRRGDRRDHLCGSCRIGCSLTRVCDHLTTKVERHIRDDSRVQMDADRHSAARVELQDDARLAAPGDVPPGLCDQPFVQEALGHVRDGLGRQPRPFGQLDTHSSPPERDG